MKGPDCRAEHPPRQRQQRHAGSGGQQEGGGGAQALVKTTRPPLSVFMPACRAAGTEGSPDCSELRQQTGSEGQGGKMALPD